MIRTLPLPLRRDRAAGAPLPVHPDALGVGAVLGLVALVALYALRRGGGTTRLDALTFFAAWYGQLGDRLRAGDVPAWNPHVFAGVPFAGDPESGWTYLPAMLLYTLLPPVVALYAFAVVHYALAGLATYALGRVLGLGVPAAVVAAAAYAFSAPMEGARCCTARSMVAAWLPLALLGVELAVRARSWPARALCWGLAGLGVSQMLAGWLGQGAYYGLLAVAAYVAYRTLLSPPIPARLRARLVGLVAHGAGVFAFGFGLAAAGLLPRLAAVDRSNLAGGVYDGAAAGAADTGGWHWVLMLDRVVSDDRVPRFYAGGAALALAVAAPLLARRRHAAPYFAGLALVSALLATDTTLLHRAFYLFPRFQVLHEHAPNRSTLTLYLAVALLAGIAAEGAARSRGRPWLPALAVGGTLLLGALAVDVLNDYGRGVPRHTSLAALAAVALLAALAVTAAPAVRRRGLPVWAAPALAALLVAAVAWEPVGRTVAADLRGDGPRPAVRDAVAVYAGGETVGGAAAFLQGRQDAALAEGAGPFRFAGYDPALLQGPDMHLGRKWNYHVYFQEPLDQALLLNNQAMGLGLYDTQGYNPLQPARHVAYVAAMNGVGQEYHESNVLPPGLGSPLLDLLNVRYLVVPAAVPPGRPDLLHLAQRLPTVHADGLVRVLENPEALPRAWVVHQARQTSTTEALHLLATGAVDPRREALLEVAPPLFAVNSGTPADPAADRVTVTRYEDDQIRLEVTTGAPGLLLLSETYDPDWTATVDGRAAPVHAANGALRAVPVPAGTSIVELRYEPRTLQAGLAITGLTLALLAALPLALVWTRRRSPAALDQAESDPRQ